MKNYLNKEERKLLAQIRYDVKVFIDINKLNNLVKRVNVGRFGRTVVLVGNNDYKALLLVDDVYYPRKEFIKELRFNFSR